MSALNYAALAATASPTYGSQMDCSVTIGGVNGGVPALYFSSFSTELSRDFVRLFDGNSTSAPARGSYSGTQLLGRMVTGASGTL